MNILMSTNLCQLKQEFTFFEALANFKLVVVSFAGKRAIQLAQKPANTTSAISITEPTPTILVTSTAELIVYTNTVTPTLVPSPTARIDPFPNIKAMNKSNTYRINVPLGKPTLCLFKRRKIVNANACNKQWSDKINKDK